LSLKQQAPNSINFETIETTGWSITIYNNATLQRKEKKERITQTQDAAQVLRKKKKSLHLLKPMYSL
jgi:hypothetical protein